MTNEEAALFLEEMSDVKPLAGEAKQIFLTPDINSASQRARRQAAQASEYFAKLSLDLALVPPLAPDDIAEFMREGVQDAVFKHLRLGKYRCHTGLDVHGYTMRQAREALIQFIAAAVARGERNVMVIHGKGYKSKPFAGLIKSCVCFWLTQMDEVLAYHSCQREHGGTGALYVMLIKSDEMRDITRETNHKGVGFR